MLNDLRFGIRTLLKSPGFTAVAVLTLALGIGANTAIFSVINAVLLRTLPYRDPDDIAILWKTVPKKNIQEDWTSYPTFKDWKDHNNVFEDMTLVFRPEAAQVVLTGNDRPERIQGAKVSANFFSVMGVSPVLGRSFSPDEGERGDQVVVLSYGFWQRQFGSSADALGNTIEVDGKKTKIIGIMPASFQFPSKESQLWLLNTADPRWPTFAWIRLADAFCGVGRLKANVSPAQAQAEMSTIARGLEKQYPDTDTGLGIKVVPLPVHFAGNNVRLALCVLFGAVVFVLLIACTNVASLVLARGAARQREFAIRTALGAGRAQLIRQLLTESAVLSLASGCLGFCLALIGIRTLVVIGPRDIPGLVDTGIDVRVLTFTLLISMLTGLLFGLAPAWKILRSDPNDSLKEGGRSATSGHGSGRTRELLVVLEFALAVVLLTGAGLLVRSFLRIQEVDLGFKPERVLMMQMTLPDSWVQDNARTTAFFERAIQKVESLPGVEAAAIGGGFGDEHIPNVTITVEGRPAVPPGEQREEASDDVISDGYFRVMGVPLLSGRFFSDQDGPHTPPVAIISQKMARQFWPEENPIGRRFHYGVPGENSDWHTVVGVVGDMLRNGLERRRMSQFYLSHRQKMWALSLYFAVRTASDPLQLAAAVRSEIQSLDKTVWLDHVTTVELWLRELGSQRRFQTSLLSLFAVVALLLAAIGIYGLMHHSVTQRTHEIGIRIALGAQPRDVLGMVIRQGLVLALIGVIAGSVCALSLTRILSSLLFGVTPTDPVTFVGVALLLLGVALSACYIPASQATKVDPMVALRYE
jgi:putative ABC transport system permease protein